MAIAWYPVINYMTYECGICSMKCPHSVYDTSKAPTPVVVEPNNCVDHCHGCGNRCPCGSYHLWWAMILAGHLRNGNQKESEPGCSCGCGETAEKKVPAEYLYLDLSTCDRCIGTDNVLDEVLTTLTPAFKLAGFEVEYNKTEIKTAELAVKYRFLPRLRSELTDRTFAGR